MIMIRELTQNQRVVITDIILLALQAGGHFELLADEELNVKLSDLGWDDNLTTKFYLDISTSRVRKVESMEMAQDELDALALELETEEIKEYAYHRMFEILKSDGLSGEEMHFINMAKRSLIPQAELVS